MSKGCPSSPKRNVCYVASMKPFSEGEPGSLGIVLRGEYRSLFALLLTSLCNFHIPGIIQKKQRFFSLSHLTLLFQLFESYIITLDYT